MVLLLVSVCPCRCCLTLSYPVLHLTVSDGVVNAVACLNISALVLVRVHVHLLQCQHVPGPLAAVSASSPMKKSRSSVPLLPDTCPPDPVPPVKKEGLFATAGLPDPEPPAPPAGPLVAIAVGKTNEGESFPANPMRVNCGVVVLACVHLT